MSLLGLGLLWASVAGAQVMARPGWAGSGVAPEPWWTRAVFYRLDPATFQDSDGDGQGDLAGVGQRLDYLQSLGIDAVVLDGATPPDADKLGDLVRGASERHVRVLVRVPEALEGGRRDEALRAVQTWLGAGVAGIWAPRSGSSSDAGGYPETVAALRSLVEHFPGQRVLLVDPSAGAAGASPRSAAATLVTVAVFPPVSAGVGPVRSSLVAAAAGTGAGTTPLLRLAEAPETHSRDAVASAALLLGSRGAVILDAGAEIGLDLFPTAVAQGSERPVMQWTPSNHTPAPVERAAAEPPKPGSVTEFGPYHPYQPPPRGLTGAPGPGVRVVPDMNVPPAPPDPDSLPGFTAGALPVRPTDGAQLNVTTEDRDPRSLLNLYRQMIGLHHGNATLRNGTETVLNHDAEGALVWVRRAPAGSRTVADVVVAVNVTEKPVVVGIDSDLVAMGLRGGTLRMLFGSDPGAETGERTGALSLPAHGVFVGEIVRSVSAARRRGR